MKLTFLLLFTFAQAGALRAEDSDFSLLWGHWESVGNSQADRVSMTVEADGTLTIKLHLDETGFDAHIPCHGSTDQIIKIDDIVIISCANTRKLRFKLVGSYDKSNGQASLTGSLFSYMKNGRVRSIPVDLTRAQETDNNSSNADASKAGAG